MTMSWRGAAFELRARAAALSGDTLGARFVRGAAWTLIGFGGAQVLRLASSLVLTRLLFPEAFGAIALVYAVMTCVSLLSDAGISQSVMRTERRDDPVFMDTAWTLQVIRGGLISLVVLAIAPVAGWLYGSPMVAALLPVAGLAAVAQGFTPTKLLLANRALRVRDVMTVELGSQIAGATVSIVASYLTGSVWSLVAGALTASATSLALATLTIEGRLNCFRLEAPAVREILALGKWILPSTMCGLVIAQSDKLVLGAFLDPGALGIYYIGAVLGGLPSMIAMAVNSKLLLPTIRAVPPWESRENFLKLRRGRCAVSAVLIGLAFMLAALGPTIVSVLYDPRYSDAGMVASLMAVAAIPSIVFYYYVNVLLVFGDSRSIFYFTSKTAVCNIIFTYGLVYKFGVTGAIIAPGLATMCALPVLRHFARRHRAWDAAHDSAAVALGLGVTLAGALFAGAV
jgi:O-antigen/teichoic acid export membrane protein